MPGPGLEDYAFANANLLNETGLVPVDVSQVTNATDLLNAFVDPGLLDPLAAQGVPATSLGALGTTPAGATAPSLNLWDRFVAWLDSVFHVNASRNA